MRRAAALSLAVLFLTAVGPAAFSAMAQDPIQVLDIDSYERTIAPGDTATFNWTIRNADIVDYTIRIAATAAPGWTVIVTPSTVQNLTPNRAASVVVTVTAPTQVDAETVLDLKVLFTVYQDGAVVFVVPRTATVTIPSIYAEKRVLGTFRNPLPAPLDNEWGVFLLDVAFWLLFSVAVVLGVMPLLRKLGARTKTKVADVIVRIVRTPILIFLFFYGALQSLSVLDRHLNPGIRELLNQVYQVALTIILVYLAYRLFKDVFIYLARTVSRKTSSYADDVIIPIAEKIGLAVIGLAGLGLLLGYLQVDLTLFIAGGVVTSMVIAFAAQDTLSNFFSGIFILTDRPFTEGDIVVLSDGDWAEVRKIGMRTTRLFRFTDASIVTIPNNKLVNEKIANFSNPGDPGRVMMKFNVAYGSDIAKVKEIIREVIAGNPHIVQSDPLKPIVRFDAMSESSLDFFVLVWIDDRQNRFDVQDYLNTEIYDRFNEAGIEIPFPQRTVHLRFEGTERASPPMDIERIVRRPASVRPDREDPDEPGDRSDRTHS